MRRNTLQQQYRTSPCARSMRPRATVLAVALLLASSIAGRTETLLWTGLSGNGSWVDPANWDPMLTPGPADDVVVALDGTYEIEVDTQAVVNSLDLSGAASGIQTLAIGASRMLTLSDNSRVGPTGCLTIRANSTLTVDKGLEIEGELDWPGGTIAGSGTTVIAPSATASLDSFVNKTLDGTLRNEGLAVWTAGPISINGTFENAGLFDIQSNWSIGSPLSSGVFHNLGTLARTTNSG